MMTIMQRQLLVVLSIFNVALAGTKFSIGSSGVSCSGGSGLVVTSLSIVCDGYCTFGSDVFVDGSGTFQIDYGIEKFREILTTESLATIC